MTATKNILALTLLLPAMLLLAACSGQENHSYSKDIFAMDTHVYCQVLAPDQASAEAALELVEDVFSRIDAVSNRFHPASEVYAVNQAAGIAPVEVSHDVLAMVETALEWSDRTGGTFNILVGGVMDLYGFGRETTRVPEPHELAGALAQMDHRKIMLDRSAATVFLAEEGMVMDLGGIAKGYATDQAALALQAAGISSALINAGGNVYALGTNQGQLWKIGVRDPKNPQGIKTVLAVSDLAVVSSGDYQRYFTVDGIRYHHIIDPSNGYPARSCTGTTVIMSSAALADILSTALFIMGPEEGIALVDELEQVEAAMILASEGGIYGSKHLNDYLVP